MDLSAKSLAFEAGAVSFLLLHLNETQLVIWSEKYYTELIDDPRNMLPSYKAIIWTIPFNHLFIHKIFQE